MPFRKGIFILYLMPAKTHENNWTEIIRPQKSLFRINFNEIWRYRDLIVLFVRRDFVATYKQTILGPLWFVLQPLFSTIIYTIVFGQIARISTDGLPQMLFYMSGIVCWNYFSSCLLSTSSTFVSNAGIFGKVYFPRLTVPISSVISNLIKFAIQFSFLFAFMVIFYFRGADFHVTKFALLIPFLLILMAGLGLGLGIIISSLTTKYRDLTNLLGFGVQLWMYATPVIYPVSGLPERFQFLITLNPVTSIVEAFRYGMLGAGTVSYPHLVYTSCFTLAMLCFGVILFNRVEKTFMDTV